MVFAVLVLWGKVTFRSISARTLVLLLKTKLWPGGKEDKLQDNLNKHKQNCEE